MAKKRKTLPKDFEELLKKGNLQELKEVFDKCELDAVGGYSKHTALGFDNCPHELAKWLVEQGANLEAPDTRGNTPLLCRSRSIYGNIGSLLELGAKVNARNNDKDTPLHEAADSHNAENTKLLMAKGARVDAVNANDFTPLDQALVSCSNIDIEETVKLAKIYLKAGVQITPEMKGFVAKIGERFEFHRASFNKKSVNKVSKALDELYLLFGVDPVAERILHDGKSPITTKAKDWEDQHQDFWEQLVPSSGPASTIQGEVIRISGRIFIELEENGGVNWDANYKKMADAFLTFIKQGVQLSDSEIEETEEIIKEVKRKEGDTTRLCELAVIWVKNNPMPIKLPAVEYKR